MDVERGHDVGEMAAVEGGDRGPTLVDAAVGRVEHGVGGEQLGERFLAVGGGDGDVAIGGGAGVGHGSSSQASGRAVLHARPAVWQAHISRGSRRPSAGRGERGVTEALRQLLQNVGPRDIAAPGG